MSELRAWNEKGWFDIYSVLKKRWRYAIIRLLRKEYKAILNYEVIYGISETPEPTFFDNRNAFRLGYQPKDRSVNQVTDSIVLKKLPDLDTIEGGVVGGGFASCGFEGDLPKVLNPS